jgi:hypothetical protein
MLSWRVSLISDATASQFLLEMSSSSRSAVEVRERKKSFLRRLAFGNGFGSYWSFCFPQRIPSDGDALPLLSFGQKIDPAVPDSGYCLGFFVL